MQEIPSQYDQLLKVMKIKQCQLFAVAPNQHLKAMMH